MMSSPAPTKQVIARKISDYGNAVTFSLLVGIVFSFFAPQVYPPWLVFIVAFLLVIGGPAAILAYAMKVKGVDFDFTDRRTRTPWYAAIEACYASGLLVFAPFLLRSWPLFNLAIVSTLLNGLCTIVNLYWKISAHAAGSAGPATGIALVFGWWTLFITVPIVVAIAWSRVVLGKHSISQVVWGVVLAVACYGAVFVLIYPLRLF
jgi:membrane-associated phospholipid phosphatase